MLAPTWSFVSVPTRLFAADTTPERPVFALHQVMAPALLLQPGLRTRKLVFGSTVMPPAPIWSLALLPVTR